MLVLQFRIFSLFKSPMRSFELDLFVAFCKHNFQSCPFSSPFPLPLTHSLKGQQFISGVIPFDLRSQNFTVRNVIMNASWNFNSETRRNLGMPEIEIQHGSSMHQQWESCTLHCLLANKSCFGVVKSVKLSVLFNFYLFICCFVAFACKDYHIVCCYWLVANSANINNS